MNKARFLIIIICFAVGSIGLTGTAHGTHGVPVLDHAASHRCFDHFGFGLEPVDVAKTADGQTVLAQVQWGYNSIIGCYLALDDFAISVLREQGLATGAPGKSTTWASRRCFDHFGFGLEPVDVAKTADGQTVLAQVQWGYNSIIGCYLVLDDVAEFVLRAKFDSSTGTSSPPSSPSDESHQGDPTRDVDELDSKQADDTNERDNRNSNENENTNESRNSNENENTNESESNSVVFVDEAIRQGNEPLATARDRFSTGTATVHVYYCAPVGRYSTSNLDNEVNRLNRTVKGFFLRESSNLAEVNFVRGGIMSPSGVDWSNTTIDQWRHDVKYGNNRYGLAPCWNLQNRHSEVLILADLRISRTWGFAQLPGNNSVTATPNRYNSLDDYLTTVAHELGHSLFNLGHTAEFSSECVPSVLYSLMNSPSCLSGLSLDTSIVVCSQRSVLGWPCESSNPDPAPTPDPPQGSVTLTVGSSAQGQSGCSSAACRFLQVSLSGFASGSHTLECWSTRGRWATLTTTRWPSTRSCWFGYPGTNVWAVVDGVRSNTVTWPHPSPTPQPTPEPTPQPQRAVTLTKGPSAQGQPGCSSVYCRYLEVTLTGFPSGSHTLECWSTRGRWATLTTTRWPSIRNCWFGYPGTDVWVVVDGTRSNTINW